MTKVLTLEVTPTSKEIGFKELCALLPYTPVVLKSRNYMLGFDDIETVAQHEMMRQKVWYFFRRFARECKKELPKQCRKKNIRSLSDGYPPRCIMPNGTKIICIHCMNTDGNFYAHFLWVAMRLWS